MLITEQDIGWALVEKGTSESMRWYHDVLKAAYIFDGVDQRIVDGISSDPVGDGLTFSIELGSGAQNQDYPSLIAPVENASACFQYRDYPGPEAGVAAVRAEHDGGGKHVYLAFGFEGIASQQNRRDVMDSIMTWFGMQKTGRSCPWNQSPGWWIGPETQSANVHTYSLYCPADRLVYTIGGVAMTNVLDRSIYFTDPETMTSEDTGVDLITPRILHAQACLHDGTGYKIYIAGGMDLEIPIYSVEMFDPISRTIQTLTSDPLPSECAGIPGTYVVADNKLFIIGAWQDLTFLTGKTWQFDPLAPAGQRWTTVPATLNFPRYIGAAAALDGKLYAIGGYTAIDDGTGNITETLFQTVEVLDLANPAAGWDDESVADLPVPLIFGGAYGVSAGANAMLAGSIVVSRGLPFESQDLTYLYHPETDTWEEYYATQESRLNRGPLVFVPTSRGPELWLIGGHRNQSIFQNMEILRLGHQPNGPYIGIRTNDSGVCAGIPLRIELDIHGSAASPPIDCYVALEAYGSYFFLTTDPLFPTFSSTPSALFTGASLAGDFGYCGQLLEIPLPLDVPAFEACIYAATIESGTGNLEGGLAWSDFRVL